MQSGAWPNAGRPIGFVGPIPAPVYILKGTRIQLQRE